MPLVTVVELPEFLREARKLMADAEVDSLIDHLARHPFAGSVIEGTGGIRKLRWALQGAANGAGRV